MAEAWEDAEARPTVAPSQGLRERLKALGYVE